MKAMRIVIDLLAQLMMTCQCRQVQVVFPIFGFIYYWLHLAKFIYRRHRVTSTTSNKLSEYIFPITEDEKVSPPLFEMNTSSDNHANDANDHMFTIDDGAFIQFISNIKSC